MQMEDASIPVLGIWLVQVLQQVSEKNKITNVGETVPSSSLESVGARSFCSDDRGTVQRGER